MAHRRVGDQDRLRDTMVDRPIGNAPSLTDIAGRLLPLLAPRVAARLGEAVQRADRGHARVLVFGEAKRGKSSLVNALFDADLLPTGVLPLTSVATVVTVGPGPDAKVRYQDGREHSITADEVADLVSERGNPSNSKGVDRVLITAPSPLLPHETEVVDTPGTGSVFHANTEESARARSLMDVAVLMVAADPPVSAAELALVSEAMRTASRAAVVVNKADLVAADDLPEIVTFTEHAVRRAIDTGIPVFVTSLRTGVGIGAFAEWLADQLRIHGATDAARSTARALRHEAGQLLDELTVEDGLLRDAGRRTATAADELDRVLQRARRSATAATDSVRGEAVRLRRLLDEDHDRQVAQARLAARRVLEEPAEGTDSPEQDAERRRARIVGDIRHRASKWFDAIMVDLDSRTHDAADQAVERLRDDLSEARRAAQDVLRLELGEPTEPARADPPQLPRLDIPPGTDWQELVSSAIGRHLPAAVRHGRRLRALRDWADTAVGQPFGRGRSTLQSWLEHSTRVIEHDLAAIWDEQLAALERALSAARALDDQRGPDREQALAGLADRIAAVRAIVDELDVLAAQSQVAEYAQR